MLKGLLRHVATFVFFTAIPLSAQTYAYQGAPFNVGLCTSGHGGPNITCVAGSVSGTVTFSGLPAGFTGNPESYISSMSFAAQGVGATANPSNLFFGKNDFIMMNGEITAWVLQFSVQTLTKKYTINTTSEPNSPDNYFDWATLLTEPSGAETIGYSYSRGQWSSGAGNPTVTVKSADLVSNNIAVTLAGSGGPTGMLTVIVNGAVNQYTMTANGRAPVGPGTYNIPLNRPQIAPDVYSSVAAQWALPTPIESDNFILPQPWNVLGIVQNTVYIKVYEKECPGSATSGYWTFSPKSCAFTAANFRPVFASQTNRNGSGLTAEGMLVHGNKVAELCSKDYPAGANSNNTFYNITSVTGSCGELADSNVAVYPNPVKEGPFFCNDQLLYVGQSTNANVGSLRDVEDACPKCKTHPAGTNNHVDNYDDLNSCTANDLPNYWEADLGSGGQKIQVPVAGSGETESVGPQASYHDSEITVQSKKIKDGLALSIESKDHHSDVNLPPEIFNVQQIERYQDRVIVIGDIGASASRVVVISMGAGVIIDSFDADNPAVSPDGRFIAFVKFYPPHDASGTEDHTMVYDITKSAAANRPVGVGLDDLDNVGLNVYPGNGNKENDNVGVPDSVSHQSASLIFWSPDSTKLAFADQTQLLKLVLVKVVSADPGAAPSVLTMAVDGTSVCAPPLLGNPCPAYLDQVRFGDTGLHTFFSGTGNLGSIHREFQVTYADFLASK